MERRIRKYLYPISLIYSGVTRFRNYLYDKGIWASATYDIPLINIGNLQVGGTGKSPMTEYLVRLLKPRYRVAVLSRGYKRKTKGFLLAHRGMTAADIGDEALQLFEKHPGILVAVDADRVHGINLLLRHPRPPEVILLDDAMQHRRISAGLNILLTPYGDLYTGDKMLPAGNLREPIPGARRAQIIVVSKCPPHLSEARQFEIARQLQVDLTQTVFFSTIVYEDHVRSARGMLTWDELKDYTVLLVTGIADPSHLLKELEAKGIRYIHKRYPDHHAFSYRDIRAVREAFEAISGHKKIILTTGKDYVRIFDRLDGIYFVPMRTEFISHGKDFDQMILQYVEQSTENR